MDLKLEVIVIPVSDVDRAKGFYKGKLGFREDIDYAAPDGGFRVIQFTPPGSKASIILGKGVTAATPGSVDRLVLAVDDIEAARRELVSKGVDVGEIFHDAGGGLGGGFYADAKKRAAGMDPQRRSYASYATFRDPDGNVWMLQDLRERLSGR
jgi:catechol 2,3-dioxygenase-like lactoylglutathione lyase family enzyme